ncbi:histidine kinase [Desulfosarcina alkanivorans]|uniref:histidine kinase n=1 Tax=Desulfosarcina alkanivorans TaxID=571177 RepID=A0A5K7YXQ3_9BACT|nr:PAS domain S-box protein [Desulfosarcina alkanivorans]BBO71074.1 histidine kinase [Desulfosarcina alkanivorans]
MTALDHYLKDKRPLLESVFNAIQDGVIVMDRDFTIVHTNRWMEEKYASQMPLIHRKCYDAFRNRQEPCSGCPCMVSLDTGKPHIEILPHPTGQRPSECFEVSVSRLEDDAGNVMGAIGHVKDITGHRQAEALLKDEINRRRILVEQSRDGIVVLKPDGKLYEANQQFARMLGYSLEELHQLHVWDWDAQFNKDQLMEMLAAIDDSGDHFETRHRRKDGTCYHVGISTNGAVYRGQKLIFCVCRDITERITEQKRIEEALLLTQFSFDKASISIFRAGKDGRILNANEQACKRLGYNREELCKMRVYDVDPGLSVEDRNKLWRRLCEKGTVNFEAVHRRRDGTTFPVDVTANLLEFKGRKYSIWFVRDITRQKNDERQKTIMEAHLRQTQRMEALGTLAGGIAHDFNNIISAVSGYAELARLRCSEHPKLQHYIDQISIGSVRAKCLVQQILTFSRQGKSEKRNIDISSVIDETLKLIRATLPSTIEIRQHIKPTIGDVFADELQIQQVIMNLCTNAFHAMQKEGGLLEVDLGPVTIGVYDSSSYPVIRPGKYLKLMVADTGHGMDQDRLAQIFDPYFTTKKSGKGTGMGLSAVHGIVKDHGGSIKVYSRAGVGTTFQVFLPLTEKPSAPPTGETRLFSSSTGYILFVDDEAQLTEIGNELLEGLGYLVETRSSPIDAIEAFRMNPNKYDLVITDMTMPKMTGEKLAEEIKKIRPDIPIILCSGFGVNIDAETLAEIGVKQVLMKPVTLNHLAKTVRKVLDHEGAEWGPLPVKEPSP